MPPLLCLSPILIDQSFPRNEDELYVAAAALDAIQDLLNDDAVNLIITNDLIELLNCIDWEQSGNLLYEIYKHLSLLFITGNKRIIHIDLSSINDFQPHPLPEGILSKGNWADEVGKLLVMHDSCFDGKTSFIGIICAHAFAGGPLCKYNLPSDTRVFPLVGPQNINELGDAYEWNYPYDIYQKHISFELAKKNINKFEGVSIENPNGGSHYKVKKPGALRPWILDPNNDPIPPRHLKELEALLNYPLPLIKTVLLTGRFPQLRLRLKKLDL